MTRRWSAHLAPIGVPTADGRIIDPAAVIIRPVHRRFAYLVVLDDEEGERNRLGFVDTLTIDDGWLTAGGVLFSPAATKEQQTLDRMRDGTLFPEMNLRETTSSVDPADADPPSLYRLHRATLAAVIAGDNPAWPDVRFHLEES